MELVSQLFHCHPAIFLVQLYPRKTAMPYKKDAALKRPDVDDNKFNKIYIILSTSL